MNEFIDENESWNTSSETDTTDTFMSIESLRCTDEKGGSRKRKAIDNCEDERIRIKKEKNKHGNEEIPNKWHIISEVLNRQIGRNSLFKERFYGSSHAVKRLYLMDSLFDEDQDSAYAVNFNREGNLLASASHKLVFIWDWSVKNLLCVFDHYTCDVIQVKWLPSDEEKIVTCVQNGYICQIYLWDAEYNMSEPLAQHDGYACKLSVHPETPNEFLSTGSDGKIFSIDIRENGPNELFVLYEDERVVPLYSINSNPLNCNEFCVSGSSRYVRVYDRRNILLPLYKFCPSHLIENEDMYVPCAIYNYSGTEILATYDNYIYLFDRLTPSSTDYAHKYSSVTNSTIDIINFFGPKSEYVIGPSYDTIVIWDKNTETIVHETYADEEGVEYFYILICLDGHPYVPVLAAGGSDPEVKIFMLK